MSRPTWWSQKYAAEGSAAAEGISRQLGRPPMDPLTILVRESAQNSWDARLADSQVEFTIGIRTLGDSADLWRATLLPGPTGILDEDLANALTPDSCLITVSDRGTRGLGGPLRADQRAPEGVVPNFVQFLRNVGEPSDQKYGGGTYGFGKGILYGVSHPHAILVDTFCVDGCGVDRRLIGASLSRSFYDGDTRYTGRHWWGDCSGEVPDPVTGDSAAEISQLLGLPGFADGRTGTDITILGANLGVDPAGEEVPRSPRAAGEFLASSILWHLWPKAGSRTRPAGMKFRVTVHGEDIRVPAPTEVPQLAGFARALDGIRLGTSTSYRRTVEPKHAGELQIELGPADPSLGGSPDAVVEAAAPVRPPLRHVARMRTAELVVDYHEGAVHPDPLLGFTGVFIASDDADRYFAASEPPTHDDWNDKGLQGTARGVVTGSRRFIREQIAALFPATTSSASSIAGLGQFAQRLGGMATSSGLGTGGSARLPDSESHDGAHGSGRTGAGGAGATGRRRSKRPTIVHGPAVEIHEAGPAVIAHILVPASARTTRLVLTPRVVLEGGGHEPEPPVGVRAPEIVGWWPVGQSEWIARGAALVVPPSENDALFGVAARYLPDVTLRFELVVTES
jgi:hypothetical protein